jgi:hypothetical protein
MFKDTDDAMRLVEIRDYLAGQGWFDLHQHRLDPSTAEPMHWSRLVDWPIAMLVTLFDLVLTPAAAEKLAIAVWPVVPFAAVLEGTRRIALRLGGAWAGAAALILVPFCMSMTWQFVPGRIDHHNVQMALSLWTIAFLLRPGLGSSAASGLCGIVGLCVGIEVLPFLAIAALCVCWRLVTDGPAARERAMAFGGSVAFSGLAGMIGLVPTSAWLVSYCDAFSLGYAGMAVVGGGGLALAAAMLPPAAGARLRLAVVLVVGGLALAAFGVADPACLRGPMAQIDPRLGPMWLDHVNEMQPLSATYRHHPLAAMASLWAPAWALASAVFLLRDADRRRSAELWALVACFGVSAVIGLLQVRTMVYANLFALPLIAAAVGVIAHREVLAGRSGPVGLLAGTLVSNVMVGVVLLSLVFPSETGQAKTAASLTGADREPCQTLGNFAELAAEPPGMVANMIDLGPFILAATRHSALAGPYHRYTAGILDADAIMRGDEETARRMLKRRDVAYVALCTASPNALLFKKSAPAGLAARLLEGQTPPWLVPLANTGPIRVWKVRGS